MTEQSSLSIIVFTNTTSIDISVTTLLSCPFDMSGYNPYLMFFYNLPSLALVYFLSTLLLNTLALLVVSSVLSLLVLYMTKTQKQAVSYLNYPISISHLSDNTVSNSLPVQPVKTVFKYKKVA